MIAHAAMLVISTLGWAKPSGPLMPVPTATAWSGSGAVAYAARPTKPEEAERLAYRMTRDEDGKPFLTAHAFLVMQVTFSLSNELYPWPAICDQFWSWDDVRRRFSLVTASWNDQDAPCTFHGTVYAKGTLIPRSDIRPSVSVYVEGEQGSVRLPIRIILDERRQTDWTGIPVFLCQISTTALADGPQRLRVVGGYREWEIDGNPGTPEFEEGGDASVSFVVQNGPPRLMELTVLAGSATAYDGVWKRAPGVIAFTRAGGEVTWPHRATGAQGTATFRFSVPVGQVEAVLVRRDGTRVTLAPANADGTDALATTWTAPLDAGEIGRGEWTFRVSARDPAGHALERLSGDAVPLASLGVIRHDSGECVAGGKPCLLGVDTVHHLTVR